MKLKSKLFKENHREVFVTNEDVNIKAAKQELLEMIVEHLPKHFPDKFESKEGGIYNKISNWKSFLKILIERLEKLSSYTSVVPIIVPGEV